METRKFVRLLCYYILPLIATILTIAQDKIGYSHILGFLAIFLILIILFIKPITLLTKHKYTALLLSYRRELGILSVWFAFLHAIGLIKLYEFYNLSNLNFTTQLILGIIALFFMLILGFTSNKFSVIKLSKNWKKVQLLAYPAMCLALIHVELSVNKTYYLSIIIIFIFIVLKFLEKKK